LLRCQRAALLVAQAVGELDVELDVKVTKVVVSVRRHSLSADNLDLARANAFSRDDVDGYPSLVQVLDVDLTAGKSSQQVDLGVVEEVVVFALEAVVGLLLNLEDDITRLDTRQLVAFAAELNLVAALGPCAR
jgi:hypothetical protein